MVFFNFLKEQNGARFLTELFRRVLVKIAFGQFEKIDEHFRVDIPWRYLIQNQIISVFDLKFEFMPANHHLEIFFHFLHQDTRLDLKQPIIATIIGFSSSLLKFLPFLHFVSWSTRSRRQILLTHNASICIINIRSRKQIFLKVKCQIFFESNY